MTVDFSSETMDARRKQYNILNAERTELSTMNSISCETTLQK